MLGFFHDGEASWKRPRALQAPRRQSAVTLPTACHYAGDCGIDQECINEQCATPCTTIAECESGYACAAGYCTLPCGLFVNWGTPTAPECAPHPCRGIYRIEGTECDGPFGDCYIP